MAKSTFSHTIVKHNIFRSMFWYLFAPQFPEIPSLQSHKHSKHSTPHPDTQTLKIKTKPCSCSPSHPPRHWYLYKPKREGWGKGFRQIRWSSPLSNETCFNQYPPTLTRGLFKQYIIPSVSARAKPLPAPNRLYIGAVAKLTSLALARGCSPAPLEINKANQKCTKPAWPIILQAFAISPAVR